MLRKLWSALVRVRRSRREPRRRLTVVVTRECLGQATAGLRENLGREHEGIVYFVGLTTGAATVALSAMAPGAATATGSVDVEAVEIGKIVREAAMADLQVVGQLHTHPGDAYHSAGDLIGMRIRHPGYFSIVVPEYGAGLPSLEQAHTLMWTADGFRELDEPVRIYAGLAS